MSILTFFNIESDLIKYLKNTQAFITTFCISSAHNAFYFSSKDHPVELAFLLLYFSKGQNLNANNNVLIAILS